MNRKENGIAMIAYIIFLCLLGAVLFFLIMGPANSLEIGNGTTLPVNPVRDTSSILINK